jgi:hypothetical protein
MESKDLKLNSIEYISPEEVAAMPTAQLVVTRTDFTNKETGVRKTNYNAEIKFDRGLTSFPIHITNDDFALLHFYSQRKSIAEQFVVPCHVRLVQTNWPEHDGYKANSTYKLDIYATEQCKWSFGLNRTKFLEVLLQGIKSGELKQYAPIVRVPSKKEEAETVKEVPAAEIAKKSKEKTEQLPF